MPEIHAIDLSHWNTVKSFADVARAGVVGVIHKATEGDSYVDDDYAPRKNDAFEAGLLWGAYHFMRPGSMQDQMEHFASTADLSAGSRLCLDHEDPLVSLDDLCEAVDILNDLVDCQISIYSGHVIKDQLGPNFNATLAKTSLWLAQYTSGTPSWPSGTWKQWSLWQYTDKGSCPGIEGDCDLNCFNGSPENCARWFGPYSEPQPEPLPVGRVKLAMDIAGDVEITVVINGEPWRPG